MNLPDERVPKRFTPGWLIALLTVFYLVGNLNAHRPLLRFTSPGGNLVVYLIITLLPLAMLAAAFWFRRWWAKLIGAILLAPIALGSTVYGIFIGLECWESLTTGHSGAACYLDKTVNMGWYRASLYTYPDIKGNAIYLLREEVEILPSVLLVRDVRDFGHTNESWLEATGPDTVRVWIEDYPLHSGQVMVRQDITLKPFLFF